MLLSLLITSIQTAGRSIAQEAHNYMDIIDDKRIMEICKQAHNTDNFYQWLRLNYNSIATIYIDQVPTLIEKWREQVNV